MAILKRATGALGFLILTSTLLTTGYAMAETKTEYSAEYYRGFSGYKHPVHPDQKITREEAQTQKAYCVAQFDKNKKLMRFTKFFEGSLFFEYNYSYYPSGALMRAEIKNKDGVVKVLEFNE